MGRTTKIGFALVTLLVGLALAFTASAPAGEGDTGPKTFDTAAAAAQALVEAAAANDDAALLALMGKEAEDLAQSGADPVVRQERARFAEAAKAKMDLQEYTDGSVRVVVGEQAWPLPIPLVQKDGTWHFDVGAAREEVLARRIGRNELGAIDICHAYADAQVTYASLDRDGDEVREYAQKIVSTPGQRDGLYWKSAEGQEAEASPFGPLVSSVKADPGSKPKGTPWGGYHWKVLTGQGQNAPGGAHSFVVNGNMIAGFALVGVPAHHGKTGVMTFLVSHHGEVLQKDLGPKSLEIVKTMDIYDADATWTEVKAEE